MRVIQAITDDDRRGAQVFATDLADALRWRGVDLETVALTSVGGTLGTPGLGPSRRSPRTILALRRLLRDADVVVAHGSTTLPVSVLAAVGTGVPVVYRQISDPVFWASTWRRRIRVAALLRCTSRVVSLSPSVRRAVAAHYWLDPADIAVVPNGVPSARFPRPSAQDRARERGELGVRDDVIVAAFVAALAPEKGADVAIRAVAALDGVCLVVAGAGPERARLEQLANELDAPVTFLGQVKNPLGVLHAADVIVFPSRGGDSMPATLIEAAFAGVPSIATRVGATAEMIQDRRTGILLAAPEPPSFSRALAELRDDPDLRRSLGDRARSVSLSCYEIEVVSSQWYDVLCDVSALE